MLTLIKPDKQTLLLEVDYTLMELFDAMQAEDDLKAFELKDRLESLRLQLIEAGHYK